MALDSRLMADRRIGDRQNKHLKVKHTIRTTMSTAVAAAAAASVVVKRTLEKVTLRVFCSSNGTGGNPVTVFICKDDGGAPLKQLTQTNLAKSCQWESVVAHVAPSIPVLSFYMPSGEEVSFCAHAAMGGIWAACSTSETCRMNVKYRTAQGGKTAKDVTLNGHRVGLYMNAHFQETQLEEQEQQDTLEHLLLHHLKIPPEAFERRGAQKWPSFCNSSVARPKTLVYLNSVDELHQAQAPAEAAEFRKGCDALQSTGIYVYTRSNVGEFQCRQFPRASGYPEDPATGIAASALAVSLKQSGRANYPTFNIMQGTAMGRPSKIIVEDVLLVGDIADLRCCGNIELEKREEIEIEE